MSRPLRWLCKECCRSHICWCKSSSGRSPGSCSGLDSSLGEISGPSWRNFQKIFLQKYRHNICFYKDHIPCLQTYLDTLTLIWRLWDIDVDMKIQMWREFKKNSLYLTKGCRMLENVTDFVARLFMSKSWFEGILKRSGTNLWLEVPNFSMIFCLS